MDLPEPDAYLEEIQRLLARRFGYPLALSPRDLEELQRWKSRGYPPAAVESGVAEALRERLEDRRPALSYCRRAVAAAAAELARRGVGGADGAGERRRPSVGESDDSDGEDAASVGRDEAGANGDSWPERGLWRSLAADQRRALTDKVRRRLAADRLRMTSRAYARTFRALLSRLLRHLDDDGAKKGGT